MKIHTNLKKKHLKNRFLLNKPVLTAFLSQIFDFYANPGEREREREQAYANASKDANDIE